MQISNGDLIPIYKILDKLIDRSDLRPDTKQAVLINHSRFESEVQSFEKVRQEILERYAEKDENGEMITETGPQGETPVFEDAEAVQEELQMLIEGEVEIQVHEMEMDPLLQHDAISGRDILAIDALLADSPLDEG
ncbi:hypothetical protein [Salinibacter phage M8CC-19]|uniref:Uncharacterized protein n=2 Tax=Kryptosalinivirus M8CC19 TaxID=2560720 RepID=A0A2I6UG78_9CAUD|nr:hypothetical protein FGG63_gp28 [Salinibacter phage M8CC-19]AUO78989.1 hypothetical protein [Salinibacter phage M8CC-19]AUO79223.1 hypothetical protein [Salinibacter phage M31CC-1]